MRERERSAAASGGLRNGLAEWVRRSGGFDEWVRRSGGFVGVGLRNGFSGFREWRGRLTGALGIARRTSLVLGGSGTRSVLGGSLLGGDDLDGGADELPAATMGAISSVLLVDRSCSLSLSLSLSLFARLKLGPEMV